MTKCQITCKSLQKSSKYQNFLRAWHLIIFRADQPKIPPCMFIGGLWSLWAEKKWRKMDIHARAAVWLVNFKDFFLSSIFVHWHTVRWSLYQDVYNDNLVTHLNIPQRCAAMYLLSTAKLLLHWAISISGWLAGPPLRLETVIVSKHITVATPSSLS